MDLGSRTALFTLISNMSLFNLNTGTYQNLDVSEQIVVNSTENQILFSGNQVHDLANSKAWLQKQIEGK